MQGMYACRSAPKLRSREASARKQVKPEAPTPDAFGIARAKPKYGTPSGVSAGSCCPHHIAARRISKQLEETQAVFFYACVSFFPQNSLRDFCGSPEIIPQNSLRDFCGSLEIIPQNSLRDFCGSPEIIPQNSLRDFCGSPENERHGWRSFFLCGKDGKTGSCGYNNPSVLPLASHRLGGARKTPPRSGNFPTMGNFQARRRSKSPPRRGKAFWSAARFVCRMTLYACRSSSHKTRHAIFVGTLKARKHLLAPYTGEAIIRRGREASAGTPSVMPPQ